MPGRLTEMQKCRVSIFLERAGATNAAAARKFGMSPQTVAAIRAGKPRKDMDKRTRANKKSAKKKQIQERRALAKKLASKKIKGKHREQVPFGGTKQIAVEIHRQTKVKYDRRTIARDLKACGFKCYVRPTRTFNKKAVADNRRRFAAKKCWTKQEYAWSVVFSDEHFADTNDRSCRMQWVRRFSKRTPRERMSRFNVPHCQLWAAVGVGFKGPMVFIEFGKDDDGKVIRMDSKRYTRRCLSRIVPQLLAQRRVFMQDGARCHTAKAVTAYLDRQGVEFIRDWPAHSPDFNPIESIWGDLDRRLSALQPAQSVEELKQQLLRVWDEFPQSDIDAYCRPFVKHMKAAVSNDPK